MRSPTVHTEEMLVGPVTQTTPRFTHPRPPPGDPAPETRCRGRTPPADRGEARPCAPGCDRPFACSSLSPWGGPMHSAARHHRPKHPIRAAVHLSRPISHPSTKLWAPYAPDLRLSRRRKPLKRKDLLVHARTKSRTQGDRFVLVKVHTIFVSQAAGRGARRADATFLDRSPQGSAGFDRRARESARGRAAPENETRRPC